MKYYDSHFHLPAATMEGLTSVLASLEKGPAGFVGGNLILTSQAEIDLICANRKLVPATITLVPLLDKALNCPAGILDAGWYKIHPVLQGITQKRISPLLDLIYSYRTPVKGVMVHYFPWGNDMEYHTSLELVMGLAERFPKMQIVVSHGGGYESWMVRAHTTGFTNISYDFAGTLAHFKGTSYLKPLQIYLKEIPDRVLFGSDWPSSDRNEQLQTLVKLAAEVGISEAELEKVIVGNAMRLWGKA